MIGVKVLAVFNSKYLLHFDVGYVIFPFQGG